MRLTILSLTLLHMVFFLDASVASTGEIPPGRFFLRFFETAKALEVYSLDPSAKDDKDGFHGYKVLGKTTVKDADTLKALIAAIKNGVLEGEKVANKEMTPRHGVRFKAGDATMDLVISARAKVYLNGKRDAEFSMSKSPQAALDKVLKAAGVESAKPGEK